MQGEIKESDICLDGVADALQDKYGPEFESALNKFAGRVYVYLAEQSFNKGDAYLAKVVVEDEDKSSLLNLCESSEGCLRVLAFDITMSLCGDGVGKATTIDLLMDQVKELTEKYLDGRYRVFYDRLPTPQRGLVAKIREKAELKFKRHGKTYWVPKENATEAESEAGIVNTKLRQARIAAKKEFHIIRKAFVAAVKRLRQESEACFSYLAAMIESHFFARERDRYRPKPQSKRTKEVKNSTGEMMLRIWKNIYGISETESIDPFEKIGLAGSVKRKQRHDHKVRLIKAFRRILAEEFGKISGKVRIGCNDFVDAIFAWLGAEVRYAKRNYSEDKV